MQQPVQPWTSWKRYKNVKCVAESKIVVYRHFPEIDAFFNAYSSSKLTKKLNQRNIRINIIIKSPRYTGGDFMFLYRSVRRRRRRRPQILVHAITFEHFFLFLSFLAWLLALSYRLIDLIRFWSIFVMTLTLNFQGQISNWLYLSQKWSDCHETKSKHISWTLGLKCDHQIYPWSWPWPRIFKVKYEICYISTKSGPIATKQKANISIWTLGLKCDNGFNLGHDIDIWIFKVICDLDHLVTKVRCKDLPDSDRCDFRCRRAVDSSSFISF